MYQFMLIKFYSIEILETLQYLIYYKPFLWLYCCFFIFRWWHGWILQKRFRGYASFNPLSQLARTSCARTSTLQNFAIGFFLASHTLQELSHLLHVFFCLIASSLLKVVDIHTIQTRQNAIQVIAMQRTNISTNSLQRSVYSQERSRFSKIVR